MSSQITGASELNKVIFRDTASAPFARKFVSLFPGLGYAAGYKVLQRIYKYGGQPVARDILSKHYGKDFESAFGKKTGKAIMHSTAGRYERISTAAKARAAGPMEADIDLV